MHQVESLVLVWAAAKKLAPNSRSFAVVASLINAPNFVGKLPFSVLGRDFLNDT